MLKEQTLQSKNIKNVGGKYRFVNHEASIVTEGYDTVVDLALAARRIPFDFGSVLQMSMKYQELYGSAIDWSKFVRSDTPAPSEPASPESERARLSLKYWGEVVPAVAAYNKENNCDVKPWDCVTFNNQRKWFDSHPKFGSSATGAYGFYVAIVYNEETKTHEPVFVGDAIWIKNNPYPVNWELFEHWKDQVQTLSKDWTRRSPKPKREFEINGEKFACPEKTPTEGGCSYRMGTQEFHFRSKEDRDRILLAFRNLLACAREQP